VVAINGSVVAVPLVGCVPLQPPEAVQDCASFALHCNVAGVPMATLLFTATRLTAGAGVAGRFGVSVVSPEDDCPHAASAENTAHASAARISVEIFIVDACCLLLLDLLSQPVSEESFDKAFGLRSIKSITRLLHKLN
jgi:hypothetical protein